MKAFLDNGFAFFCTSECVSVLRVTSGCSVNCFLIVLEEKRYDKISYRRMRMNDGFVETIQRKVSKEMGMLCPPLPAPICSPVSSSLNLTKKIKQRCECLHTVRCVKFPDR